MTLARPAIARWTLSAVAVLALGAATAAAQDSETEEDSSAPVRVEPEASADGSDQTDAPDEGAGELAETDDTGSDAQPDPDTADDPAADPAEAEPEVEEPGPTTVTIGTDGPDSTDGPNTAVVAPTPGPATTPPDQRNYVGVVVGISAYANLPDAVELDFGRADAATVAKALEDKAGFDKVFLLGDGEASKEALSEVLRTQVAQHVGPNDVLVVYYVGHGIGDDLGVPVLLTYDSTLEDGQNDGFEVSAFARDLQTWTRAGTALIVTDVVHRNSLDGIYFYGPAADSWPSLPKNWMVLSASQGRSPGKDGAFAPVFAEAIGGAADANRDRYVTAAELFAYVVSQMSPQGQIPLATGNYDGGMVVAQGVRDAPPEPEPDPDPPEPDPPPEPIVQIEKVTVYPDYPVRAAKFVWADGSGQSVQCREEPVVACSPSCYVRDFKAGPCQLRAIFDGIDMNGEVVVLGPGKYDCRRRGGELECTGP